MRGNSMNEIIGVVGAKGDLGSQLTKIIGKTHSNIRTFTRESQLTLSDFIQQCDIVHICAPVEVLKNVVHTGNTVVVLHDSVMHTSRQASEAYLNGKGAIIHMLMNDHSSVIVARDAPHHDLLQQHLRNIGLSPFSMTIKEHDYMAARSQAPLALLCKTLLPYLYEKADQGLLTPSGQLLADTLRSRELAWTDATVKSILKNPELQTLVTDMQQTLDTHQ